MSCNILLVDDHAIVTDGLRSLLSEHDAYFIKGEARNGKEALEFLSMLKVDLVLMDIDMPEMDGIEATKAIKKAYPDIRVIILTMHDERSMIKRLLEEGADGYLLKNSTREDLLQAMEEVMAGKQHLSAEVNTVLMAKESDQKGGLAGLTEREIEIVRLIAEGLSNKEIGDKLFISHRTVDTHRTNLMQKLGVHNIAALVRLAIREGLV